MHVYFNELINVHTLCGVGTQEHNNIIVNSKHTETLVGRNYSYYDRYLQVHHCIINNYGNW